MKYCIFDLETIPNPNISEECLPVFSDGRLKDPVKITKAKEAFKEKAIYKMSTDPVLCIPIAFSHTIYDSDGLSSDCILNGAFCRKTDRETLYDFILGTMKTLTDLYTQKIPIVTFNGKSFDFKVLFHSCVREDITISKKMFSDVFKRYSAPSHYDLLELLAGYKKDEWKGKGLNFWLSLYNIGKKAGDGSEVYQMYKDKKFDEIGAYCNQDVALTTQLWERVEPWIKVEEKINLNKKGKNNVSL